MVSPGPSPDDVRATLISVAAQRGESLAALSRLIGRNDAYLQQFVARGSPRTLAEGDRAVLARYLGIDERLLGARDPWSPTGAGHFTRGPR